MKTFLVVALILISCGPAVANLAPFKCEQTEAELAFIQDEAKKGSAQAQLDLAKLYKKGLCFHERNGDEIAFTWIQKAADQGLLEAQLELAAAYLHGQGIPQDAKKGLEIYHRLAEQNSSVAAYYLGETYITGIRDDIHTVHPDVNKALFWYGTAADQGMIQAMDRLGSLYRDESSALFDLDMSSSWYRKAAESGDVFAMIELAENLLKSDLDENKQEAAKWHHNAAELGAAKAQLALAQSYALGRGIERDHEMAYMWYRIAKNNGSTNLEFETELTAELTKAQILEAEKKVREYLQTHAPGRVVVKD